MNIIEFSEALDLIVEDMKETGSTAVKIYYNDFQLCGPSMDPALTDGGTEVVSISTSQKWSLVERHLEREVELDDCTSIEEIAPFSRYSIWAPKSNDMDSEAVRTSFEKLKRRRDLGSITKMELIEEREFEVTFSFSGVLISTFTAKNLEAAKEAAEMASSDLCLDIDARCYSSEPDNWSVQESEINSMEVDLVDVA